MRGNTRIIFWLIIFLTIITIVIDLPKTISLHFNGKIPFINKQISVNNDLKGFNSNFYIGSFHFQKNLEFKKGLDLQGGTSVTLLADMKDVKPDQRDTALEGARLVVERRVNLYGVSEPVVQTAKVKDQDRIIVELPGVTDLSQAVALIGQTAQLTFWEEGPANSATASAQKNIPLGLTVGFTNPTKTDLSGKDIQSASASFDQQTGAPDVLIQFTGDGTKKFADISTRNVGKPVAMVLDNVVVSAPIIQQPILTGNAQITGTFTTQQTNLLAEQLNAGALPVPLHVLQSQSIGATLGQESLSKSLFAGVLGFLIIVIFMISLYGRLGVIASLALILYTLIVFAIFKWIPVTLTLAGIAGFILSIGMAVDANILIFERMREELRLGKSSVTSIELGFQRAWTSIRDSNISSIITALILLYFGTGTVRGFAVTLLIGVMISMFSAIVVTRTLLRLIYKL